MGVKMSDEAAKTVENRFDNLAQEFWDLKSVMDTVEQSIETATGTLYSQCSGDVGDFRIGWRATFDVSCTSAALIAGNTNRMHVDLTALDRDADHALELDLTI